MPDPVSPLHGGFPETGKAGNGPGKHFHIGIQEKNGITPGQGGPLVVSPGKTVIGWVENNGYPIAVGTEDLSGVIPGIVVDHNDIQGSFTGLQ